MLARTLIAASLLAAAPAAARESAPAAETRIPRIAHFLEWVADGERGVYIQADTGRWYYARTQAPCPRLTGGAAVGFETRGGRDLDRFGAIRAEGWRCDLASVTASPGPPRARN